MGFGLGFWFRVFGFWASGFGGSGLGGLGFGGLGFGLGFSFYLWLGSGWV